MKKNSAAHSLPSVFRRLRCRAIDNKICFAAFLLPFVSMLAIFIGNEIFPFGDESFMHSDMYHQYVPFLQEFLRKLTKGDSLFYSRNVGMGANYLALYAYYSASPFNWLVIFVPQQYVIEFMSYMVIFKIGCCSFTFSYFLKEKFRTKDFTILLFSVFYAMSGFVAAYNWNVMWLDCLILAPMIILGLEKLVKKGRAGLYCITLALCILSNYYISIMVCIFLCLYFLVLLPELAKGDGAKAFGKRALLAAGRFSLYSLLTGGMCAVLLLPEIAALYFTEYADFNFPQKVTWYFSFLDVIARHAVGVKKETGLDHWPNIFCSSAVFFLIPLYACNTKIKLREKVGHLALCAFLLVSFSVNTLNFIWHGFNYPNSLPCRQSFLYILLVLTMCFEAVHRLDGYDSKTLFRCLGGGLFFLLLAEKLVTDDAFTTDNFVLSAALLAVYALLLYLHQKLQTAPQTPAASEKIAEKSGDADEGETNIIFDAPRILALAAVAVVTFEATFHMASTSVSTTSRSKYLEALPAYETLAQRTMETDTDFYRFEKFSRVTKNDGTLVGYPTASLFSSTANGNVEHWYDRMGLSESKVFYCFDGQTPLSSAMLNVRYMFSRSADEDSELYTLIDQEEDVYLYRCNYTLPAGYIVDDSWNLKSETLENTASTPFDLQNRMVLSTGTAAELFETAEVSESGGTAQVFVEKSGHYYAYCSNTKVDTVKLNSDSVNKTFRKIKYDYILDLGHHDAGDLITLDNQDDGDLQATVCLLNQEALAQTLNTIGQQQLTVDSWDSTHVNGHITVTNPGTLVLSIAYEPGWSLKVDGQEVEIEMYDTMFISTELSAGEHTIELSYAPADLIPGLIISISSLIAFLVLQWAQGQLPHQQKMWS